MRLVGTSITVAEATAPGTYSALIHVTDVTGARASTEVVVEVYHIRARIGGTLSVSTPDGKVASDSLTVRTDEEVILSGTVINDGMWTVPYAEVRVYDKDLLLDDDLGASKTGKDGRFSVEFRWSDYKDGVYESRPDIYVKVRNPETGRTTKSPVFYELEGDLADDDSEEVMDLGDVEVD